MDKRPIPFERKLIASPEDYTPLSEECEVRGAFNPGVAQIKTENGLETILMMRVAESPNHNHPLWLPYFDIPNQHNHSKLEINFDKLFKREILKENKENVKLKEKKIYRLKHISLPRLLRLDEKGNIIERKQEPCLYPSWEHERFGIEDVRITDMTKSGLDEIINNLKNYIKGEIGYGQSLQGNYVLTYVTPHREERVSTSFIITKDFKNFERLPEGNTPRPVVEGKDVIPFPEKVRFPHKTESIKKNQKVYVGFIRPNAFPDMSIPGIWIAYSPDGITWGTPHKLISDGKKTGSGTPPIKVKNRWLAVYHEVTEIGKKSRYDAKLISLDEKDPWKNCKTSEILLKREDYRDILPKDGYTKNVVYPTGMIINDGITTIFVGIDDTWTVMDKFYTEDMIKFLER